MYIRYRDDDISNLSAQLSFFILLSMFPFLLFLLSILSYTPVSALEFTENIIKLMPADVGSFISGVIKEMVNARSTVLLSLGAIITIWGASGGISALSRGLNKAYDNNETRSFIKIKLMSVFFTIGIAVLIIITLLFMIFGGIIGSFISELLAYPPAFMAFWGPLRYAIPIFIMFLTFSLLYIFVPCCKIKAREVLPGAMFTTIGWIVISLLFSFYVNNFTGFTRIYGSIGGVIILFIWIYISSIIIMLGGEINATFAYYRNNIKLDKYENKNILPAWLRKRLKKRSNVN